MSSLDGRNRPATVLTMKFLCHLKQEGGRWTGEHAGPEVGPIRVTASTRNEALGKLEAEIRYWLELCPCSGRAVQGIDIELIETG
jgi:hypothetical protein